MIALVAGTGDLPGILAARLIAAGDPPVICALAGFPPDVPAHLPRLDFRLETLGTLLATLALRGVTRLCLAGAVRRMPVDPAAVDAATAPLIPDLVAAMDRGDDGALRAIIALLERRGFAVVGAADIAPDLILPPGIPTAATPPDALRPLVPAAQDRLAEMGRRDSGQACIAGPAGVIAEEGPEGTDALIAALIPPTEGQGAEGAFLFKAPKPGQELRADMPVIGPQTAMRAAEAGLAGIVIEAGGVMVIDPGQTIAILDGLGMFLWVRERAWR